MKQQIDILLVVVLYRQKLWDCNSYMTLIKDNANMPLLIYDNSPTPQHCQSEFAVNVKYVSDTSNSGLSFANNRAADYAKNIGIEWMLLLDQDTFFAPNILEEYRQSVRENPRIKLFAPPMTIDGGSYMSPVRVHFHAARPAKKVPQGVLSLKKYAPINSGQLINVSALHEVGGYNENVPLDFCEYQFHKRLLKKCDVFFVLRTVCKQEFSDQVQNPEQKLKRFEIFCRCLKNCEKDGLLDRMAYNYVVFKRAASLIHFCGTLKPLKILIKTYF